MTSAIRSRVHSSPTNPLATAPLRRACSTSTSWASDRRGGGPVGPRLVRAVRPPAFQAPSQRVAAWRETRSWRATSAAWLPAAKSSAARSRRAWRCWRLRWAWGRRGAVGIGYSWSGGGRVRPHTSITSPQSPNPVKLFAVWCLSFLPGWLYVRFLGLRAGALWDEYVLYLHRLGWDRPAHLPEPARNSDFYQEWLDDGGKGQPKEQKIYRPKFAPHYGRAVSEPPRAT